MFFNTNWIFWYFSLYFEETERSQRLAERWITNEHRFGGASYRFDPRIQVIHFSSNKWILVDHCSISLATHEKNMFFWQNIGQNAYLLIEKKNNNNCYDKQLRNLTKKVFYRNKKIIFWLKLQLNFSVLFFLALSTIMGSGKNSKTRTR